MQRVDNSSLNANMMLFLVTILCCVCACDNLTALLCRNIELCASLRIFLPNNLYVIILIIFYAQDDRTELMEQNGKHPEWIWIAKASTGSKGRSA